MQSEISECHVASFQTLSKESFFFSCCLSFTFSFFSFNLTPIPGPERSQHLNYSVIIIYKLLITLGSKNINTFHNIGC